MDIIKILQDELKIQRYQIENTIQLIEQGNTIPFIARYRKELTGSLNDEILRYFGERFAYLQNLQTRQQQVLKSIDEQGQLTPVLKQAIENTITMTELEDLYLPYRPKKRTRATVAKEKGLEPLAHIIMEQKQKNIERIAEEFIDIEKGVEDFKIALDGAKDILAEIISEQSNYRGHIRTLTFKQGMIVSKAKDEKEKTVYDMYYQYSEKLTDIPGHRILAINRGEQEKVLSVKIEAPIEEIFRYLQRQIIIKESTTQAILEEIILDSYKRLIAPAVERDIRGELTQRAEDGALEVFKKNLYQLLMQSPIKGHYVMGVDPAYRTGCKIAVVDQTGKKIAKTVVYPTPPQNKVEEAKQELRKLIEDYHIDLIAIGNGTASRETEKFIAELIKQIPRPIHYVIVNEAGASVYSASKLASEEFPNEDVGVRSAVSIARRLQDPLAELVKIDPKSIGIGQYQHDMNQKRLETSLAGVVEGAVNEVGVDINTASASLLQYVAGIKKTVSQNIISYREEKGYFSSREEIKKVKGLGPKVYEQCAGFLRITEGENFLDATGVHPESYATTNKLLAYLGYSKACFKNKDFKDIRNHVLDREALAKKLEVGVPTLLDIIGELEKPGRDPREDMPKPILHSEVLDLKDLKEGMKLKGTVRNIVDFGAFVDIGVHQDGLVHISQMSHQFIKHPLEVVKIGDVVEVIILSVDLEKHKVALSMKL